MGKTKIQWADMVWNPVTGCTKVSQGCKYCYAETFYERFHGRDSFRHVTMHPDKIDEPMGWKEPQVVFVNSMSDLFHEAVTFEFIHKIFNTCAACPRHLFLVLTKRPERMLSYIFWFQKNGKYNINLGPNVWLGVSTEDQATYDERFKSLAQTPNSDGFRFLSCEPLLGEITMKAYCPYCARYLQSLSPTCGTCFTRTVRPDWVIVGGESGRNARPTNPQWVNSLLKQCEQWGIPFWFKQWGEWGPFDAAMKTLKDTETFMDKKFKDLWIWKDGHTTEEANWRDIDNGLCEEMFRLGSKVAGNELNKKIYEQRPKYEYRDPEVTE